MTNHTGGAMPGKTRGHKLTTYIRSTELRDWMDEAGVSPASVLQIAADRVRRAVAGLDPDGDLLAQVEQLEDPTVKAILANLGTIHLDRAVRATR